MAESAEHIAAADASLDEDVAQPSVPLSEKNLKALHQRRQRDTAFEMRVVWYLKGVSGDDGTSKCELLQRHLLQHLSESVAEDAGSSEGSDSSIFALDDLFKSDTASQPSNAAASDLIRRHLASPADSVGSAPPTPFIHHSRSESAASTASFLSAPANLSHDNDTSQAVAAQSNTAVDLHSNIDSIIALARAERAADSDEDDGSETEWSDDNDDNLQGDEEAMSSDVPSTTDAEGYVPFNPLSPRSQRHVVAQLEQRRHIALAAELQELRQERPIDRVFSQGQAAQLSRTLARQPQAQQDEPRRHQQRGRGRRPPTPPPRPRRGNQTIAAELQQLRHSAAVSRAFFVQQEHQQHHQQQHRPLAHPAGGQSGNETELDHARSGFAARLASALSMTPAPVAAQRRSVQTRRPSTSAQRGHVSSLRQGSPLAYQSQTHSSSATQQRWATQSRSQHENTAPSRPAQDDDDDGVRPALASRVQRVMSRAEDPTLPPHERVTHEVQDDIRQLLARQLVSELLSGDLRTVLELHIGQRAATRGVVSNTSSEQVPQTLRRIHRAGAVDEQYMPQPYGSQRRRAGPPMPPPAPPSDDWEDDDRHDHHVHYRQHQHDEHGHMAPGAQAGRITELERQLSDMSRQIDDVVRMVNLSFSLQLENQRTLQHQLAPFAVNAPKTGHHAQGHAAAASQDSSQEPNARLSSRCVVCMENQADTVVYKCGHLCLCSLCGWDLKTRKLPCPCCRGPVTDILRVYQA